MEWILLVQPQVHFTWGVETESQQKISSRGRGSRAKLAGFRIRVIAAIWFAVSGADSGIAHDKSDVRHLPVVAMFTRPRERPVRKSLIPYRAAESSTLHRGEDDRAFHG